MRQWQRRATKALSPQGWPGKQHTDTHTHTDTDIHWADVQRHIQPTTDFTETLVSPTQLCDSVLSAVPLLFSWFSALISPSVRHPHILRFQLLRVKLALLIARSVLCRSSQVPIRTLYLPARLLSAPPYVRCDGENSLEAAAAAAASRRSPPSRPCLNASVTPHNPPAA